MHLLDGKVHSLGVKMVYGLTLIIMPLEVKTECNSEE